MVHAIGFAPADALAYFIRAFQPTAQLPDLRYIGVLATGYNIVDVDAARKHGIVVTNIPTYGTDSVAQFAFALLLELCHRVGTHSDAVKMRYVDWARLAEPKIAEFALKSH
mgnify:CR=1 FL=1